MILLVCNHVNTSRFYLAAVLSSFVSDARCTRIKFTTKKPRIFLHPHLTPSGKVLPSGSNYNDCGNIKITINNDEFCDTIHFAKLVSRLASKAIEVNSKAKNDAFFSWKSLELVLKFSLNIKRKCYDNRSKVVNEIISEINECSKAVNGVISEINRYQQR